MHTHLVFRAAAWRTRTSRRLPAAWIGPPPHRRGLYIQHYAMNKYINKTPEIIYTYIYYMHLYM